MGASSPVSFFSLSDIIQRIYRNVEKKERKKERKMTSKHQLIAFTATIRLQLFSVHRVISAYNITRSLGSES